MPTSRIAALPALACAVLLTLSAPGGAAEGPARPVAAVIVRGAESLSDRAVRDLLVPDAAAPFDEVALGGRADSLLSVLAARGRPFAAVRVAWSDTAGGVRLTVRLDEGPEARLDTLRIERAGATGAPPGEAAGVPAQDTPPALPRGADAGLARGAVVSASRLGGAIRAMLEPYRTAGRPLATISPGVALAGERGLDLTLVVDAGPAVRLGDVTVRGNSVTKTGVILRETGIARGDLYDERKLERVRPRLERLGLFASVDEPVVAFDRGAGLANVGIEVAEGPSSSVAGVLGYDASGGGEGQVTGFVDVALGNIAGTARRAEASWQRLTAGHTRTAFSYTEPWVLGAPLDVGVSGTQVVRDTLYTTTEADLLVTARMGERTRVTWSVGGERYVPGSTLGRTTTTARTALSADLDWTDSPANPTEGFHLAGAAEYGAKEEEDGGGRGRSGTISAIAEVFLEVRTRQVVAVAARLAAILSTEDDVPFHEQLTLGGARSLRGYREEQFRGTRTALGTAEYRFILSRRSRALAFVDAGYYYRRGASEAKGVKVGYGIGLRADTRLGIIGVDYGLGEGDRLLDGKLHVGLSREF